MPRQLTLASLLVIALLLVPAAGAAHAVPAAPAGSSVDVRIGVTTDGIVRLTAADLAAAGIDPATIDPRTLALTTQGQPVALRVTGADDGQLDPNDVIEFFGQRFRGPEMEQKYTDERVYWLTSGGAAGLRIPDVTATPSGTLTRRPISPTPCMRRRNSCGTPCARSPWASTPGSGRGCRWAPPPA